MEDARVDLFLHEQAIDTTTPAGRMFFHVTGAFAEFEREMIRNRVNVGWTGHVYGAFGLAGKVETAIKERLMAGVGMLKVAKGLGVSTVQRVKTEMAVAPSS